MPTPGQPLENRFISVMRRIYRPTGFSKGYNFALWFVLGGAFLGFSLSRLMYLNIDGILCAGKPAHRSPAAPGAAPGECYYYRKRVGRAGIIMHLGIRHRMLLFHRINDYMILLLSVMSTVSVFLMARNTFGGTLDVQVLMGLTSIVFVFSLALAYYNIKRLQLEQHRAWMLRAWATAGKVITMRLISKIMRMIASTPGPYYTVRPCAVVDHMFRNSQVIVEKLYPECANYYSGENPNQHVTIPADMASGRPDQMSSGLIVTFGASGWLALVIHLIAVEVYLHLTPAEAERLRRVSYQKRIEAGMENPGNAGLTVQRFGDAHPWTCPREARITDQGESTSTVAVATSEGIVQKPNSS